MTQGRCPACGEGTPAGSRFCNACGLPLGTASQHPTVAEPRRPSPEPAPRSPAPPSREPASSAKGGFAPGTLVGERFRIVTLLGRGGMGVVYRADDLRLGQPVALKVLPEVVTRDPERISAIHDEVRVSRSVSHPNVCRVFDVGEADGVTFLSMEYVDGEDLASLLRRIGRLPAPKLLELAHQLCAGLAAAHDRGVVHRDLKPANVMLDGHGQARITDFGLAVAGADDPRALGRAGTPAYMAPEQLAGEPATVRSDLFALGLVLYEAATGRHAFPARSLEELRRAQASGAATPTSRAPDLDPSLEKAILRCLEAEPSARPSSARDVAALLPGGDPLLAALEAGRTPSPEMVAAAGGEGALPPRTAAALLAGIALALAVATWAGRSPIAPGAPERKSPEVLRERAREIAARTGLPAERADEVLVLVPRRGPSPDVARRGGAPSRPEAAFEAIWRASPQFLIPRTPGARVWGNDPPNDVPGMSGLRLAADGRLLGLIRVPLPEEGHAPGRAPPWPLLLAEARLDSGALVSRPAQTLPPVPFDERAEWTLAGESGGETLVRAAALGGVPVFFDVRDAADDGGLPWTTDRPAPRSRVLGAVFTLLALVLWAGGAIFARRNLRLGRGDRRGAFRFAGAFFVLNLVALALRAHWVPDARLAFFSVLRTPAAVAVLQALGIWLLYLAVEPSFRARWPRLFVSWSRMLAGRFRDAALGRDVLLGLACGSAWAAAIALARLSPALAALLGGLRAFADPAPVLGTAAFLAHVLGILSTSLVLTFPGLMLLLVSRLVLRREAVALAAAIALWAVAFAWLGDSPFPVAVLASVGAFLVIFRFGVLSLFAAAFASRLLGSLPAAIPGPGWLAEPQLLGLAILLVVAAWAFRTSLGGRPLLVRDDL